MVTANKFLFETYFDGPDPAELEAEAEPAVPPPPTFSEEELAAAQARGFVEGRSEGIAEVQASLEHRVSVVLEEIVGKMDALGAAHEASLDDIRARAIELSATIARKAFPEIMRDRAAEVIETMVRDCLPLLKDEPRIVLRVNGTMLDALRESVDGLATRSGFPGDIILLGDDQIGEFDCLVEWADGGAERNSTRIWDEIDRALADFRGALDTPDAAAAEPAPDKRPPDEPPSDPRTAAPEPGTDPEIQSDDQSPEENLNG